MALITLRQLLDHAAEYFYGVPAFNVNNLEQVQAIMAAADEVNAPVILQASAGARQYAGPGFLKALLDCAVKEYPHIPVCLHQDHGSSIAVCLRSIQLGFSSVMMDGSLMEDMKTPSSYEYNLEVTRTAAEVAHACGVSIEGELGCLGSFETSLASKEDGSGAEGVLSKRQMLTDPYQALDFVKKTKVDALAIAIGTSHGAYKFSSPPSDETLSLSQLKVIHSLLPSTHFVLHGASSVELYLQEQINDFGGQIQKTYGVPVSSIVQSMKYGVRKINIDTDLRLAATGAIRRFLFENPGSFDPRHYLALARNAMQKVCVERFNAFGTSDKAQLIKPIALEKMRALYV